MEKHEKYNDTVTKKRQNWLIFAIALLCFFVAGVQVNHIEMALRLRQQFILFLFCFCFCCFFIDFFVTSMECISRPIPSFQNGKQRCDLLKNCHAPSLCVCVCVFVCLFVCLCVCEREREREREGGSSHW